jgi:hypothetical protein
MTKNEYRSFLLKSLSDMDCLDVRVMIVDNDSDTITLYLRDGSDFTIFVDNSYNKMIENSSMYDTIFSS